MSKTSLALKALLGVAVFASALTVLLATSSNDPSTPFPVTPRPTDPVAAAFTDWVEADLLPVSPEWVTDAWDSVVLGDLDNYDDAYAGYFSGGPDGIGEIGPDQLSNEGHLASTWPVRCVTPRPYSLGVTFIRFENRLSMVIVAAVVAGAGYGFFGPSRNPTCGGEFRADDWVANHLYCPGLTALSMIWWVLIVGAVVAWVVNHMGVGSD